MLRELIGLDWAERQDVRELPDSIGKVVSLLQKTI